MKSLFPPPIGIAIGERTLKAVQLVNDKTGFHFHAFGREEMEKNPFSEEKDPEAFVSVIKALKKKGGFKGRRVVIGLPGRVINSFPMMFQGKNGQSFEEELVEAARRHLAFPLEEAVIDYPSHHRIEKNNHQSATLIAVKRADIDTIMHCFKKAGFSVEAIEYGLSALIRLDNHLFTLTEKPKILCYIGHHKSLIAIITNDNIYAQRDVNWGTGSIAERVAHNLGLSHQENDPLFLMKNFGLGYEDIRKKKGGKHDISFYRMMAQLMIPYVEILIHELHQMMGYVRTSSKGLSPYEGIYLYGHSGMIRGISPYIENQMGIRTHKVRALRTFYQKKTILDKEQPDALDIPLGLSLRRLSWL